MTPRPFEAFRQRRLNELDAVYQDRLAAGFSTSDFANQPEPETLQCRNDLDRTNWIGLLLKAQAMIGAGLGSDLCDPPLRCTSNRMYAVPWSEVQTRLFALLDVVAAAQKRWWDLKDALRAIPSADDGGRREMLNDIDITTGWP